MKRNISFLQTVFPILLFIALGCNFSIKPGYYEDDIKLAKPLIPKIIEQYNKKDFENLYANLHPNVKAEIGKKDFEKSINKMHEEFGKIENTNLENTNVKTIALKERIVHFLYNAEFSKSNEMLHIAVITNDQNEARFSGINIYGIADRDELMKDLERK